MKTRELERLNDLLAKLSEESTNPQLRDQIADVRAAVWARLEAHELRYWTETGA